MNRKKLIKSIGSGFIGAFATISIFFAISQAMAAPTSDPPGGNPSLPLSAPAGFSGPQGPQGNIGPAGPQGTTNCTICLRQCDFNGAGPCSSVCANQNTGYQGLNVQGIMDSNDQLSVRLDC